MQDAVPFFRLKRVEIPWGDYGAILAHGLSMSRGRVEGLIQLDRTGPTIAPITFPAPGDVVVTDDFRSALEKSGLTGFTFQPVTKNHIVELDWESWDITADDPEEYPDTGEPEDYLRHRPHSPRASYELGRLWELVVHDGIEVEHDGMNLRLLPETWDGTDFFQSRTSAVIWGSLKARRWLEHHYGDYVEFEPVEVSR